MLSDTLEFIGSLGGMLLVWLVFKFMVDPEETMELLGRCIRAFRRGLSGESTDRRDAPASTPRPGPDSR